MTASRASFRDPAGFCCVINGRVLRVLHSADAAVCEAYLQTPSATAFLNRKQLVSTRKWDDAEREALADAPETAWLLEASKTQTILEHECIPFPSFPHEWPPEMLWAAGKLTLELAQKSLADGYGLKDATPFNVLFRGPQPIFVDLASFEARTPADPIWLPYGQFVRTFLLPLLANRYWKLPLADVFITHRDGLEPKDVYQFCSW